MPAENPTTRGLDSLEPDDPYEVVGSQGGLKPPSTACDSLIASRLAHALIRFDPEARQGQTLAEMSYLLDCSTMFCRRPSVSFVSAQRWPVNRLVARSNAWDMVPDMAIELVSPSTATDSVIQKVDDSFRAGVRLVWLALPGQKRVYAYTSPTSVRILQVGEDLEGGEVLPGLKIPLATRFKDARRSPDPCG